jgi:hypothetical protein
MPNLFPNYYGINKHTYHHRTNWKPFDEQKAHFGRL